MLDFLKNVDISDNTINELNNRLDKSMIFDLNTNAENVLGIIIFMKKVGINNISLLLLNKPDWFLKRCDTFIEKINSNQEYLVNKINTDYENVSL